MLKAPTHGGVKGFSIQPYPCFILEGGWFEPRTSKATTGETLHCARPTLAKDVTMSVKYVAVTVI